jgi:hypothetical protein
LTFFHPAQYNINSLPNAGWPFRFLPRPLGAPERVGARHEQITDEYQKESDPGMLLWSIIFS